jgi:hypothetical protein
MMTAAHQKMNPTPKTLQIFLPEGTPAGIQIAELTTRIVQAIAVPRTRLKEFYARPEAKHVGIYFLFGSEDDDSKPLAYIGQTEDLKQRLRSHDAKKEFWSTAVILVSRTHSFTQAHIKWLEWHSIAQSKQANRFKLENGNDASEPHVTEGILADLHEIFETGALLLQSLGYPIFEPLIGRHTPDPQNDNWFLKRRGAEATASFTNEGFVVHKGSTCSRDLTPSAKDSPFAKKRLKMLEDGTLEDTGKALRFTEDYKFNSPSGAAATVSGGHANGWISWKNKAGKTLQEVKREA